MLCVFQRDTGGLGVYLKPGHCSRLQIRFDVSWIQVGNAHKKAWSRESPEFTKAKARVLQERKRERELIIPPTSYLFYHIENETSASQEQRI